MGVNEGSLQVIDIEVILKIAYCNNIRYIVTSSIVALVTA